MMLPSNEEAVRDIVLEAIASETPLSLRGEGTRTGYGRAGACTQMLSTAALTGITLYEPAELVLSARAGTPLRDIVALLEQRGQELAFEPMDHAAFYGGTPGGGTIGGLVAVNAAGPRRIKAGAARDHVLGFRCVTGRGDIVITADVPLAIARAYYVAMMPPRGPVFVSVPVDDWDQAHFLILRALVEWAPHFPRARAIGLEVRLGAGAGAGVGL